jgi:sugar phosphate isomerase/epimerase
VVSSAAAARRLIDEIASPRVKIVFDAANLFEVATSLERREIVSRSLDLLADRIAMAHAKDRNADGSFATAGKGVLDYPHYLGGLRRIGFQGALVTHGLEADEAAPVAAFLRRTLAAAAEA